MVFCYSISKDISQFAELLRNNDTQLWIVTERPIVSVDEILTSAGVQDYTTNRLIIDRLDTNELKDHLKYVDGLLDKNQSQRLQSVLYVSCDSLYAFSKAEVEHV
jgi:phosphoglycolate phosphatase-like HAD superfamily hydrolase